MKPFLLCCSVCLLIIGCTEARVVNDNKTGDNTIIEYKTISYYPRLEYYNVRVNNLFVEGLARNEVLLNASYDELQNMNRGVFPWNALSVKFAIGGDGQETNNSVIENKIKESLDMIYPVETKIAINDDGSMPEDSPHDIYYADAAITDLSVFFVSGETFVEITDYCKITARENVGRWMVSSDFSNVGIIPVEGMPISKYLDFKPIVNSDLICSLNSEPPLTFPAAGEVKICIALSSGLVLESKSQNLELLPYKDYQNKL